MTRISILLKSVPFETDKLTRFLQTRWNPTPKMFGVNIARQFAARPHWSRNSESVEIRPKSPDVNLETRPDIKVVRNTKPSRHPLTEQEPSGRSEP